ncbi:asparagine synthase (glutamine-hydrolyzing) [Cytophagales bacterium LB-30]|uniref:asparagine synthase (glutamine-hydrolyzing) n=1 Tax=Shiella aurantiaca TaxID=3058365 RepID=A0ABT8F8L5_9BACT|nr:asparagine synthase (glutamine-hydrolyzing) [Shiella aurantiaca]MDN4166623.1 asparagine synthase (glutamine-hydrolyzing) [Shiella aurantiaca]
MCGIVGAISSANHSLDLSSLHRMRDAMEKRGPDAFGDFFLSNFLYLGHRRLSIIDLESGTQPMLAADGKVAIVFNGEIYNFKHIRAKLQKEGVLFATHSDTEVIIQAYLTWGLHSCLEALEGMFAFALWDERVQKVFVARDRYGEKPLYYTKNQQSFFFASELKALKDFYSKDALSVTALNLFFSLSYIPAPHTIYEGVYKLLPGNYLEIDTNGDFYIRPYYSLKQVVENAQSHLITNYEQAKKALRDLLFTSVEEKMIADVPLGSFLSGGIDSSIISAIMAKLSPKPIKTFSIGFKEKAYDESERAALVASHIGSDHTLHILGHEDLLAVVDDTLAYFDEPFGDSSAIPSMMVAKKAKEKVTVVLTGDCADELFGGYEKYLGKYYAEKYGDYPSALRKLFEWGIGHVPHTNLTNHSLRKVKKVIESASLSPQARYLRLASLGFSPEEKKELLKATWEIPVSDTILSHFLAVNKEDELTQTFYSDIQLVLEGDMLTKVDRACMINSLEARVPFLDSRIVDFSFRLPHEFKILGKNKKRILKDTFADLLPKETMRFSKKGFGLPLRVWFQNELKEELYRLLDDKLVKEQSLFNSDYLKRLLKEHMENKENHASKLWQLYVFQKWYYKQ